MTRTPELRLYVAILDPGAALPNRSVAVVATTMAEAADVVDALTLKGEGVARLEWYNVPLFMAPNVPAILGVEGYGSLTPPPPAYGPPSPEFGAVHKVSELKLPQEAVEEILHAARLAEVSNPAMTTHRITVAVQRALTTLARGGGR